MSTREAYQDRFDSLGEAIEFENRALSIGEEFMPACALAVLNGGEDTPEYLAWLTASVDEADRESAAWDAEHADAEVGS